MRLGFRFRWSSPLTFAKRIYPPFPASLPHPRTTASSRNAGSLRQLLLYRIWLLTSAIQEILLTNAKRTSGLASHSLF
jgi:hypothetical protein